MVSPPQLPIFLAGSARPLYAPAGEAVECRIMTRLTILCSCVMCLSAGPTPVDDLPWVAIAKDKKGFRLEPAGRPFAPLGFNYDHDDRGRLLEDYWNAEWPTVEEDFQEMKQLGANVVRVHLQLGKFM